uniref:Large ribosomal subunit protein uL4c n=1 Tax=Spumella sp. NIES-1846 TaxID=2490549 RepID=A0A455REE4_9STRA|nr:ribosomal protein L4 [Spumella sp. NIES-1846]
MKFNKLTKNCISLIHKIYTLIQLKKKVALATTKTKAEVKGSGKKPWKQKGTGKARAGSIRSPLWRGGGIIFGPKYHSIFLKFNKYEKKLCLLYIFKLKEKNIFIINKIFTLKKLFSYIPKTNKNYLFLFTSINNFIQKTFLINTIYNINILNLLNAKYIFISFFTLNLLKYI